MTEKLTRQHLLDASMFTIFWVGDDDAAGDIEYNGMHPDEVIESNDGGPQDADVIEQLELRGVTIGDHVERDDELTAGKELDDLDAVLAYLRYHDKPVIKVPDRLTGPSRFFKFYVVRRLGW